MNRNEIILILFLYTLMVLFSSSKTLLNQVKSCAFVKNLSYELQKPFYLSTRLERIAVTTNPSNPVPSKNDYTKYQLKGFSNSMGVATTKKSDSNTQLLNG